MNVTSWIGHKSLKFNLIEISKNKITLSNYRRIKQPFLKAKRPFKHPFVYAALKPQNQCQLLHTCFEILYICVVHILQTKAGRMRCIITPDSHMWSLRKRQVKQSSMTNGLVRMVVTAPRDHDYQVEHHLARNQAPGDDQDPKN